MIKFVVWSTIGGRPRGEDRDREKTAVEEPVQNVIEVTRTDRRVAEEDAALIRDLFRRKAWVQDSESSQGLAK